MPRHVLHIESERQRLRSLAVAEAVKLYRSNLLDHQVAALIRMDDRFAKLFDGYSDPVVSAKVDSIVRAARGMTTRARKISAKRSISRLRSGVS
ncbi:hypothetical protein [Microcystis phage Mwe-JY26]